MCVVLFVDRIATKHIDRDRPASNDISICCLRFKKQASNWHATTWLVHGAVVPAIILILTCTIEHSRIKRSFGRRFYDESTSIPPRNFRRAPASPGQLYRFASKLCVHCRWNFNDQSEITLVVSFRFVSFRFVLFRYANLCSVRQCLTTRL